MRGIPYGRQYITQEDIDSVVSVLKSDLLTQGPTVKEFEKAFSSEVHSKYSVAVSNGTAALHLAVKALGLKPGEKVITTPITFAASANSVLYEGGQVEFCDIDEETFCLSYESVKEKLKSAPRGTFKGVILVDFAGFPVNTEKFKKLCNEFNLWIIEDACHAPGAWFQNDSKEKVFAGSCKYADLTVFSFHPVKHIACGEGGMITTNNKNLFEKLCILRTHGITKESENISKSHSEEGWYYEMTDLGYNYRLSDIHAALGLSQLKNLNKNISKRIEIINQYKEKLKEYPIVFQAAKSNNSNAYHLCVIQVEKRKKLYSYLVKNGIFPQIHYIPIYKQPYYAKNLPANFQLPKAESYYQKCLSLPLYYSLSEGDLEYVIKKIKSFF